MKYIDINRKFTAAVSSYMMQGYTLNSSTMGGSQGEIASIDLTNGTEIIRVLLNGFSDYKEMVTDGGIELIVGQVTDDVHPNKANEYRTVWNNRLEVISNEKFYKLSSNRDDEPFYGTEDEAKAAMEKRFSRYTNRDTYRTPEDITAKAAPIVKRYVHEQFGVRRVKMEDIKVTKHKGVYVCEACGTDEALRDWAGNVKPLSDWVLVRVYNGDLRR